MAGEIKQMIIMLLLVSVVLIGCASFYGSIATEYGATGVDDISELSSHEEAQELSANMRDSIKEAKLTNIPAIDVPYMIISGGYNALMLVFDSVMYMVALISDLILFSGLPLGWLEGIIIAIVTVTLSFGVLNALLKWEV